MRKVNLDKNDLVSFSSQLDVLEACGYKMERKGNFVKSIIINDEIIKMPLIGYINDLYKEEINKCSVKAYEFCKIRPHFSNDWLSKLK